MRRGVLALTLTLASACAAPPPAPPLRARSVPAALDLCADYGAAAGIDGAPYHLVAEDGRVVTRHEGIDFCAPCGAAVIAPASGVIVRVERDDPRQGGRVTIRIADALFADALHIVPAAALATGADIRAGDRIGDVGPAGLECVGPVAHVHLSVRATLAAASHLNPHEYWRDGPGDVSCFTGPDPPGPGKIVAPLLCAR